MHARFSETLVNIYCAVTPSGHCVSLLHPVAEQSILISSIIAGHPDKSAIPKTCGAGEALLCADVLSRIGVQQQQVCFHYLFWTVYVFFLGQVWCARCGSISYCVCG